MDTHICTQILSIVRFRIQLLSSIQLKSAIRPIPTLRSNRLKFFKRIYYSRTLTQNQRMRFDRSPYLRWEPISENWPQSGGTQNKSISRSSTYDNPWELRNNHLKCRLCILGPLPTPNNKGHAFSSEGTR
jgi:hypothetical protein